MKNWKSPGNFKKYIRTYNWRDKWSLRLRQNFSSQITVLESLNFDLYLKSTGKVLKKCEWKVLEPVTVHVKNLNTPLHKIPKSFSNVIEIEALRFRLGSKFIQERNQRFWFFRYWMTCYNRIVCGCQVWEYYNDNDRKEFSVGSLDFMKGRVAF